MWIRQFDCIAHSGCDREQGSGRDKKGATINCSGHSTLLYNVKLSHVDQHSYTASFIIYPKCPINA